ncbi:MAG: amino acid ABC transporter ATP-binding protein, partial [Acidimicrobiales bacterium]|nr:amino acid ABC transporter ATP-binding protein [Acidimicrobiales bacterium]
MTADPTSPPLLKVSGVHKSFGTKVVLQGVDLEVAPHGVVCLIGPSGCGKSTLLRCINLLEPVDAGLIELDGERISGKGVNANAVRRRVGIVFQSFNLFPHLSVLDNVTLGPRRVRKVPRRQAEERAREVLDRFG